MSDELTLETLKAMSRSGKKKADSVGVKEEPSWNFVEVDNYSCPILHNQINLSNNFFQNLLDYGNEYIEKLSVDEDLPRNSLLLIDSSTNGQVNLREGFDASDEGKELNSLKKISRNDKSLITHMTDEI